VRLSLKELTIVAALGALWGSVEMTLGSFLHVLNIPFTGAVLGSIGICIALVGRVVVPKPGSTLSIAIIAALLKALSIGGVVLSPMIAIVMEGLLADVVLSVGGRPRRSTFIVAGAVAVTWNTLHMILIQGVVFGAGIIQMYVIMVQKAASLFHIPASSVIAILVALVAMHVVAGSVAGLVAWEAGRSVLARRSLAGIDVEDPTG
jgi:hypothetical protein